MKRGSANFVHVAAAAAALSGLVLGWMCYFAEPADEFAVVNHPWQSDVLHLHIISVPLLVFACGLIWHSHIWSKIVTRARSRRRSGLVLAILLFPMIASGYAVQVVEDPDWRQLWGIGHSVVSTLWVLAYALHQFSPARKRAAASNNLERS